MKSKYESPDAEILQVCLHGIVMGSSDPEFNGFGQEDDLSNE